jgi:arylsulfatase A-like enzyme
MTLATQLDASGYYTVYSGKYLNGVAQVADKTPAGWDRAVIGTGGYIGYTLWDQGVREIHTSPDEYSADVFTDKAVRHLADAPAGPVFLMLAPFATHGDGKATHPIPARRHENDPRCADAGVRRGGAYNEADMSDKPTFLRDLPLQPYRTGWPLGPACRALLAVDEMFARVRATMKAQGRTNVVYVFTADNGMAWGDHRWATKGVPWSTRMPLYVRWPGRDAGARVVTDHVSNIDMAPSLAALAGTTLGPYPTGQAAPDGLDVSALFTGGPGPDRRSLISEHQRNAFPKWYALRTTGHHRLGRWHYVEWDDGQRELYDLEADPDELRNRHDHPRTSHVRSELALELAVLKSR